MPSVSLPIAVRPVRVGFLVRSGSLEDLRRAVVMCTGLWGGVFNPIIPVSEVTQDSAAEMIRAFGVDVVVPITRTDPIDAVTTAHKHLRWATFPFDEPLVRENTRGGRQFTLFDVSAPLYQYWWDEGRHDAARGLLPQWSWDAERAHMYAVSFGAFPSSESNDLPDLADSYRKATKAEVMNIDTIAPQGGWLEQHTPINATRLGLGLYAWRGFIEAGLVIGDPRNADHLSAFWNLRANGARVLFCPEKGPYDWAELYKAHIHKQIGDATDSPFRFLFWICSSFTDQQPASPQGLEIPEAITALAPQDARIQLSVLATNRPWTIGPGTTRSQTERKSVLATVEDRYGTKYLSAQLSGLPFIEGRTQSEQHMQQWMLCLEPYSFWDAAEGWTLKLPYLPDLNDWYSQQIHPDSPGSLRVQPQGFDLMEYSTQDSIGIFPVRATDLVIRLMQRADIKMTISTPGRLALRILDMIGDRRRTALFRIRGVRKLLSSHEGRRGISFPRAVQIILDKDPRTKVPSFQMFKDYWREASPESTFRTLLSWEIFRPGLTLKCPNCVLTSVVDVDEVGREVSCPLCNHAFLLGPRLTGKEWVFKASGVFAREGGPEGAIPGLLAWGELDRAGRLVDELTLLPAHHLVAPDEPCESDLIALEIAPHEGFPTICIGECKSEGHIDERDIRNLVAIRQRIRATGVECFIVIAILRDNFADEELMTLRTFVESLDGERALGLPYGEYREAAPLILLTRRALEADPWFRPTQAADSLPHAHPVSFRDMAENSRAAYYRKERADKPPLLDTLGEGDSAQPRGR